MKSVLLPLALLATAVTAQTSSACAADYIVEACLGTIAGQLAACGLTDYGCQCSQYQQYVVCFNNCPNDPRLSTYKGQEQTYCSLASQYPSSTSTPFSAPATTTTAAATTTTDDSSAGATDSTGSAASSATSTGSAAQASKTNSAADLALNAGGVLAAIAGVVAAVL